MKSILFDQNEVTVIASDGNVTIDNGNPPRDFTLSAYVLKDTLKNRKMVLIVANNWAAENQARGTE